MSTTLYLDFDNGAVLDESRLGFLLETLDEHVRFRAIYKTRRGHHIEIELYGDYPPCSVVAMQAILGSDPRRETFNLLRALQLGSAPKFWRQLGRWNTLYAEKLEREATRMINPKDFGTGRDPLKIDALGDADVAIWTIESVEETTIQQDGADKNKLILTVEEFPELAYWVNVTGIRALVAKLGSDENKWIGKKVPFIRATTNDPRTRNQVDVLWIAAPDKWDELLDQFSGRRRRTVGAGKRVTKGAKSAGKKAASKRR